MIKRILFFTFLSFALSSCKQEYLYDKAGFDAGTMPSDEKNPNAPVRVAPDYYHRQPAPQAAQQPYPPQPYLVQDPAQEPYRGQPGQAPVYYQQQPPYQGQAYQQRGGSRYYSNPYALPPSAHQYPNYDADQYYVPPTYYQNVEPQQQNLKQPQQPAY